MIDQRIRNKFINELREEYLKFEGVENIEFFGSFTTKKWRHGKSDIDIIVYGQNLSDNTKYKMSQLLRKLNYKYNLNLENVQCAHPTPFFLDSPQRITIFQQTMKGHSIFIEIGREFIKNNALTYSQIWDLEDKTKVFENLGLVPPLSKIFDKFR
jgi:predicted nucleotidyltransferase